MFFPFGDTGVGKMGEMPPTSQELRKRASADRAAMDRSVRTPRVTLGSISTLEIATRIESRSDCGRSPKAQIRRRVQPQHVGRVSALRPPHGPLRRPLPQLRLQALAFERGRLAAFKAWRDGDPSRAE